jgi:hypothetical protein
LAQWPALLPTLHAMQVLQALVVQQTPSTQKRPVWHPFPHGLPAGCLSPQRLFLGSHRLGDTQSAVVPQLRKQSLVAGLHRKAPQEDIAPPLLQAPLPSQVLAAVTVDIPVGQEAAVHCVPAGYFWQAPAPSHFPLLPHVAAPLSTQRESAVLAETGLHMPAVPVRLQETQGPVQALVQQTPWAQVRPVWHSALPEQVAPGGFRPHEPLVQT